MVTDYRSFWAGIITGLGLRGFRLVPDETGQETGIHAAASNAGYNRWDFLAGLVVGMNLAGGEVL